jgi:hypothetical protein
MHSTVKNKNGLCAVSLTAQSNSIEPDCAADQLVHRLDSCCSKCIHSTSVIDGTMAGLQNGGRVLERQWRGVWAQRMDGSGARGWGRDGETRLRMLVTEYPESWVKIPYLYLRPEVLYTRTNSPLHNSRITLAQTPVQRLLQAWSAMLSGLQRAWKRVP